MLMRMISSVLGGGLLLAGGAQAVEPEKVWQAEGLDGPESAVLDSGEGVLYVSNVNGDAAAAAATATSPSCRSRARSWTRNG
jgi:hypothetical protein